MPQEPYPFPLRSRAPRVGRGPGCCCHRPALNGPGGHPAPLNRPVLVTRTRLREASNMSPPAPPSSQLFHTLRPRAWGHGGRCGRGAGVTASTWGAWTTPLLRAGPRPPRKLTGKQPGHPRTPFQAQVQLLSVWPGCVLLWLRPSYPARPAEACAHHHVCAWPVEKPHPGQLFLEPPSTSSETPLRGYPATPPYPRSLAACPLTWPVFGDLASPF